MHCSECRFDLRGHVCQEHRTSHGTRLHELLLLLWLLGQFACVPRSTAFNAFRSLAAGLHCAGGTEMVTDNGRKWWKEQAVGKAGRYGRPQEHRGKRWQEKKSFSPLLSLPLRLPLCSVFYLSALPSGSSLHASPLQCSGVKGAKVQCNQNQGACRRTCLLCTGGQEPHPATDPGTVAARTLGLPPRQLSSSFLQPYIIRRARA